MGERIILSILLAVMISTIASIPYASAVIVDGTIGGTEYANSVLVDKTPDLFGVYDPGLVPTSFGGGPVNCHDDWRLYWDFDATNIYFAADPLGAGSSCADAEMGVFLLPVTGDPNIEEPLGYPNDDCTGTIFSMLAHNNYLSLTCDFTGPPLAFTLLEFGATDAPTSTESFAFNAVTTELLPIEWSNVRADLARAGDTTYDDSLQCVWFRVSAFDSRSVNNSDGPGVRTIWLKLDPSTSQCGGGDTPVGGIFIPIDTSSLLLAGVQSISMWMIPVVVAGIGVGVFVIKRRN